MNKSSLLSQPSSFCGIDVSAKTLAIAVIDPQGHLKQCEFANTSNGHQRLLAYLRKCSASVRISLEATGIYSLDLALTLDAEPWIELAVLNPKLVSRFAETLRRSKTDSADAMVLASYSQRMPFVRWQRPADKHLELRTLSRYIGSLVHEQTALKNRLHTAQSTATTPRMILADIQRALVTVERRVERLRAAALKLIRDDEQMHRRYLLLTSIPGIAQTNGVAILSELLLLAPEMGVRQWVASSGLDPAHQQSGTSIHKPSRISRAGNRYLRTALYMSSLSASRYDVHLRRFYQSLRQRNKTGMQALMAVARKLLHAIYGIFKTAMPYDGQKLFPQMEKEILAVAA